MIKKITNLATKLPLLFLIIAILYAIVSRPLLYTDKPLTKKMSLARQYVTHNLTAQHNTIHGIDVSHNQGNIDWPKVMATDVRFVYLKATDGITYVDPKFHTNMKDLLKLDTLYGAYHFFEAEDNPERQATNFIKQISMYPFNLSPMVDVEITKGQSTRVIQARLKIFLDKVQAATGCPPIIYSYGSFWEANIGEQYDQYVFWLADYAKKPKLPKAIKNWNLWQYSEKGKVHGISGPVDLDVIVTGEAGLKKIMCKNILGSK